MAYFSKMIKCGHCGGNFKSKMERGKRKYVCSRYDNLQTKCKRIPVDEHFLLELIESRYEKKLTKEEIKELVSYIEVFDKRKNREGTDQYILNVYFKKDKPIILDETFLQL